MERKEAIDVIKKNWPDSSFTMLREALETLIPELKENKDERIKKWLINYFREVCDNVAEKEKKGVLAWLEKQGEQKPIISNNALREGITHFGITQYQIDNWLKKYVDVEKQGEQKHAWSEEDELIVAKILYICNDFERSFECSPSSTKVIKEDVDKIDNWLKSLKDRYTWKPSDEQMEVLAWCKPLFADPKLKGILESLIEDLKKLREE